MPYNNTPIEPSKEITGHVSLPVARVQKIINADPERINVSKNATFAITLATEMFIQHLATTTHNVVKAERKPRRNIQYRDVSSAVSKTDNLEFLVDVVPKTVTYKEFKKRQEEKEKLAEKEGKGKGKVAVANGVAPAAALSAVLNGDAATSPTPIVVDSQPAATPSQGQNVVSADQANGHMAFTQASTKPEEPPEAMEVDPQEQKQDVPDRVPDSEPEDDAAAMQLEMEMRGPPRPAPSVSASPEVPRRTSGFTAINGSR